MQTFYNVQRYGTWEWLQLNAQITSDGPGYALSKPGMMKFEVLSNPVCADGSLLYEEWGTLIYRDTSGKVDKRRWGGIVTDVQENGGKWEISAIETTGYANKNPVDVLIRGTGTDPAVLFRSVWQAIQTHQNGWLNVDVIGSTPQSAWLGTDSDDKVAAARALMDERKRQYDAFSKTKTDKTKELQDSTTTLADEVTAAETAVTAAETVVADLIKNKAPQDQVDDAMSTVTARRTSLANIRKAYATEAEAARNARKNAGKNQEAAKKLHEQASEAYKKATDKAREDGGAYEIRPESLTDASRAIDDICKASGIEWTTRHIYSDSVPRTIIDIHYPRAGTTRDDLVFSESINIVSELNPTRDGDEYANAGYAVGAGEGDAAIRATVANASRRLRRPYVLEDKSVRDRKLLSAMLRDAVMVRDGKAYVSSITVIEHPLAPIGSWRCGDIITVVGTAKKTGKRYVQKHRVIAWRYKGEGKAELTLKPANR